MKAWSAPEVPRLPGHGSLPRVYDTSRQELVSVAVSDGIAQLYVCGITPYDATHLGHAATYLAYDTLNRVLRDASLSVDYVQNVTDVDDPLLERAIATSMDWPELAEAQIELFRADMQALRIIPPEHYVGVVESIDVIAAACERLLNEGFAYWVDSVDAAPDLYFDITAAAELSPWFLGQESRLDRETMLRLSAERGGDPERAGKRDSLDPLLWRAERLGEPAWASPVGRGRPGWHIECSAIGAHFLSAPISLNGGGSDLIFPHHEMSAAHSAALSGIQWSHSYSHAGMVAFEGEKMSKSLGNLVFVSKLRADGIDPRAIRLALLAHHYRSDWEWSSAELVAGQSQLHAWTQWADHPLGVPLPSEKSTNASPTVNEILGSLRTTLCEDLNSPNALSLVDDFIATGEPPHPVLLDAIDALLGINL